jgi:hypothetical protein
MNELQIKITADVKDIQSALTRVKKTLKDFEDSMSTTSDKSNGNLERQKGIIEQLNAKINSYKTSITRALSEQEIAKYNAKLQETQKDLARLNALGKVFEQTSVKVKEQTGLIGQLSAKLKELKGSLQQATTEKEVERLNIELAETSKELTRISSLGKVFEKNTVQVQEQTGLIGKLNSQLKQLKLSLQQATSEEEVARLNVELAQTSSELTRINSLGRNITDPAVKSFNNLKSSAGAATGSAIAFNRIIQDAPFGIIGVGNNIQQFAEQFAALGGKSATAGQKISQFFTALLTPANLAILAISAVTSALTFYALNAEKTKSPLDELTEAQEEFNKSLKDTNAILAQDLLNNLLKDVGLLKTENIGGRLIDVPAFKNAGEVVDALAGKFNNLRKGELELLERFLKEELATATRNFANSNDDLGKSLATDDINLYKGILQDVNKQLAFYTDSNKKAKESNTDFIQNAIDEWDLLEEQILYAIQARIRYNDIFNNATSKLTGDEGIDPIIDIQNKIAQGLESMGLPVKETAEQADEMKSIINDLAQSFTGLGSLIGRAFNNPQLGTFLGEFLGFAAKLVAANFKIAGSNAVAGASQASLATGAAAPITLPAFIAGALGVVAAAFAAFGNFGTSGSSSMSSGQGSTFTNRREFGGPVSKGRAYIVGEKRPELFVPNTNGIIVPQVPSMDYSGASMAAGAMAVDVNIRGVSYGDDILFTVQQAQIRRGIR